MKQISFRINNLQMSTENTFKGCDNLLKVSRLISLVYSQLERNNPNVNTFLNNYTKTLRESMDQLSGSKAIVLPAYLEPNLEKAVANEDTVREYMQYLIDWTAKIQDKLKESDERNLDKKQSIDIIEYWRSRSSILGTLTQDLLKDTVTEVKKRVTVYFNRNDKHPDNPVPNFELNLNNLIKANSEAKDNSKFLNTLERQFKILQSGNLSNIEQCIPSLLNGLRLVFIISRYYKQEDKISKLLSTIANEICDRVKQKVDIKELLRRREDVSYTDTLNHAGQVIQQGQSVLDHWVKQFLATKELLEKDGGELWDFSTTEIVKVPKDIQSLLEKFHRITDQLQKLLELLGPKLKSVAGSSEGLDKLVAKAMNLVEPFEHYEGDFYNLAKDPSDKSNAIFVKFKNESTKIENDATTLIQSTFEVLRSSESGFEFLQKFKVDSLEEVANNLQRCYENVLGNYRAELENNKRIFEKGKELYESEHEDSILTKNKPSVAGAIAWEKSILSRIKAPMVRFYPKESVFNKDEFKKIQTEYMEFYDELEKFQSDIFKDWIKKVNEKASDFLETHILSVSGEKYNKVFTVNLPQEFKGLISEAKYLDKMVPNVPKKLLNIALQEEEYYRHIDKIEKMLREYNSAVNSLKDVEKDLLQEHVEKLENKLHAGTTSYYLNSLGISDFIEECRSEIKRFLDKKNKVEEKTRNIEDIIKTIEDAKIFRDYDFSHLSKKNVDLQAYPSLPEFQSYFEKYLSTQVESLADKYRKIGQAMLPQISMAVFEGTGNTDSNSKMRNYYYYWERRVYNALVKMVAKALLTFKALLKRHRRPDLPDIPLFRVSTDLMNQKVVANPNEKEISNAMESIRDNIIESTKKFPRWKDGTCKCCDISDAGKNEDKPRHVYTFYEEIHSNKVINEISAEINQMVLEANERLLKILKEWEIVDEEEIGNEEEGGMIEQHKKSLFNQKFKVKIDKMLETENSSIFFEVYLDIMHQLYLAYQSERSEFNADFVKVDLTKIKKTFESKARDRIKAMSAILIKDVDKKYEELYSQIRDYYSEIKKEEENRDQVKACLNTLTKIRDSTEDNERKIAELIEKCSILKKYSEFGIEFDDSKYNNCTDLGRLWTKLLHKAKQKHDSIKNSLIMFERQTKAEVDKLQKEIDKQFEMYKKIGPGALETSLSEGVEKMNHFRKVVDELNASRSETVKMQKLFGIEITAFPKLVEIDEELKKLDILYNFYSKVKANIDELSRKQWEKFDLKELVDISRMFKNKVNKEFATNPSLASTNVFKKLETYYQDFSKPLGMIDQIKSNQHFKETHWERLLKLIDKPTEGINFSQITLQQVLNLALHEHQERVEDIMTAAHSEYKNKKDLAVIEEFWRAANFEIAEHKKGGFKIRVPDEVKTALDEHLNNLQSIEGNKYAGTALKKEVRKWMDQLVKIQDTIDEWIKVQTKWLYLEGIYIGNEDIRAQLSKETKTFEQHHKLFKGYNEKVAKTPNILSNCVGNDSTLDALRNLSSNFDVSQKKLTNYLHSKMNIFPRFYFISEEDLLSILGSSDPTSIQPHLIKLFDNVKSLVFERGKITQMVSDEGESFAFTEPYKPDGAVEIWMTKVDNLMVDTLRKITKEGVFNYAKMDRTEWMQKYICMVVLVTRQIWWTWRVEDVFRKVKEEADKYAMKKELDVQCKELNDLIGLVQGELEVIDPSGRLRRQINNQIIIDVHARDIVDRFVKDSILDAKEFEWESQLRFYWKMNLNDIQIEQCTGTFRYGYEYQGLTSRLVITPLTDRCVMTLTTALTFFLGGAPAGPAGTGKTETCKDLGKNLAIRAVVTNCGENFDVTAMGHQYSGLCQTGFWGVFDEFNRILPEVLSVISTQISDIQRALASQKTTVDLMEEEISIKPTIGIFVTMNPGYEGRSELPDNLKALFRPVTMVVPNLKIICENMLMSEGFKEARVLAKKMTVLYQLAKEQLSKQYHYDFGLRALKSVLVMAGSLKRGSQELTEEEVLMRALKDMNMPKFVFEDVKLFINLIKDLFPEINPDSISNVDLRMKATDCQIKKGLQAHEDQVNKVIQLKETMDTRHTTMVVGPTGSGKSAIIDLLKETLTVPNMTNVVYYLLNPKAQGLYELYGVLDESREWKEGILSKIFKIANEDLPERGPTDKGPKEELRWILFDGDVDAVWVENMNSVMDDNKLLTLSSGDRIKLKNFCKLLFEVYDLQYASPATISRCGMVYVDPKNLGWEPYYKSWQQKLTAKEETKEQLDADFEELCGKYIKPLVEYLFEGKSTEDPNSEGSGKAVELSIGRTDLNIVQQFTNLMDTLMPEDKGVLAMDKMRLENMFIYSVLWSFGSCIKNEKDIDNFFNQFKSINAQPFPENRNLFDNLFEGSSWVSVKHRVKEYVPPENGDFNKILVPTADTVKYSHLLNLLMGKAKPTLFVGDPGTAKTIIIKSYLSSLKLESYSILTMNFSSRTDSMEVQKNIENVTVKKRFGVYGPEGNKKLVIFIDELHMPRVDKYGTQQPIALLKLLIDKKLMYERGGALERREYKECQYVAALLPPGGGYNSVDPRFLSLFNCFNIQFPKKENIITIYKSILQHHFRGFPKEFDELSGEITEATYKMFQKIVDALPRSPIKFHYIFNLRDLSKLYQGLLRSTPKVFNSKEKLVRLWKNESLRVFVDKLITVEDKNTVQVTIMNQIIKETFGDEMVKKMSEGDFLYGDFEKSQPLDPENEDPQIYNNLESFAKVREKCEDMLQQYNEENPEMNLVLFDDALDHLVRLLRVLKFDRGNSMLVGFGGSGKQSLTKLATFISCYKLFMIQLKKNYNEKSFKADIFEFYFNRLINEQTVFMFNDSQAIDDSFLEIINTLLTVGVVNNLFDQSTRSALIQIVGEKYKKSGSSDEMWELVCDTFRNNLHIVLCMSPAGDSLRVKCRSFPGLISNTTIDWFFPWPAEALKSVAEVNLKDLSFEEDMYEKIVSHFVFVHKSIPEFARRFEVLTRRKVYNTPKNYLDFLKCYITNLEKNKKKYSDIIANYEKGLEKLEQTKGEIAEMKIVIEREKGVADQRKKEVAEIKKNISEQQAIATVENANAVEKEAELTEQNKKIREEKKKADDKFEEKKPELEAAKEKVRKIDKKNLSYVASLGKPPQLIVEVGKVMQILNVNSKCDPSGLEWQTCQAALREATIMDDLAEYDIKNAKASQIKKAQDQIDYINKVKGEKSIASASSAIADIFSWANSTISLYGVFVEIKEIEGIVNKLTEQQKQAESELNRIKNKISELNQSMAVLKVKEEENDREIRELNHKIATWTKNLNNAIELLDGLSAEQIRWTKDKDDKTQKIGFLVGDSLLCASFLSYFGPFDKEIRREMTEAYKEDIITKSIPMSEGFRIEDLLTTDVQVTTWNSEGLPNDEVSIQNGILTTQSMRYPLCIDPQLQAMKWIKKKEKNVVTKYTTNFNDPDLTKKLENSFREGDALLIENVGEDIDPIIDNILLKKYFTVGGVQKVKIGDKDVDVPMGRGVEKEFILYLTTKLPNPSYSPEIMGKANVINFSVDMNGLTEQLLSEVVKNESPEDDALRSSLITKTSQRLQDLSRLQKGILERLVKSQTNIIQDEDLISKLQESKANSKQIEEDLITSRRTTEILEKARKDYVPIARRGATLFFCMQKLSAISDMYQYSLSSFLEVFKRSMIECQDKEKISRIESIKEILNKNVYDYVVLGVFKNHRRIFTFQMVLMIKAEVASVNQKELDFFLKGNTKIGGETNQRIVPWLTETNTRDIESLVELGDKWRQFANDLQNNESSWRKWFELENPEMHPLPEPFNELIKTRFELLLILRVMRPDRISLGIDELIKENLGNDYFIRMPILKDKWLLSQTSANTPIIYILSPGADPSSYIRNLAYANNFTGKKFLVTSLGQGMEKQAYDMVESAYARGYWVLLQNCDLLPHCIKELEKKLEAQTKAPNPDFRFWMTTQPTSAFPLGILQRSLKIVTEPPAGIKNNMEDIINRVPEEQIKACAHQAFKPLTYVLIFLHAVVLDRAKYGKIGWNVTYDFNFSDFQISFRLLKLYLDKSLKNKEESIPWDSLKYLIGEAMYGGRVTDDYDRRTLMTYLDEYMGDFLFDKKNKFCFTKKGGYVYELPEFEDKSGLAAAAALLPNADSPVVFGLNANAEITYYTNDAKSLWNNFLKMESVGTTNITPQERDEKIREIATDLLEKTKFSRDPVVEKSNRLNEGKDLTPTEVVLFQEMDRFKKLANKINTTLQNLLRALSGKIGMNHELDELAISLYNAFLPKSWAMLAPSTEKKLGSWIQHYIKRREQYIRWNDEGEPVVMWISGLHMPGSYLTALVQTECRAKKWALDKSTLTTKVTHITDPTSISKRPESICYITGLFLEGISWDIERNSVRSQHPKELIYTMPVMEVTPIEINKLKLKDSIKIPVYVTQNRRNAKGEGHVFDADLSTMEHASHWILQGAALVMNTDE